LAEEIEDESFRSPYALSLKALARWRRDDLSYND